jgi:excisionase family DNA binding protein
LFVSFVSFKNIHNFDKTEELMEAVLRKTTKSDQQLAQSSLKGFESATYKVHSAQSRGVKINIQETGETITIPKNALLFLSDILQNMAEGKTISIIPSDSELSTQQAADMLNVSRPHLVKVLESGLLPFTKVGSHRRISLNDLISFQENSKKNRTKQLNFLAKQAQELNLGYE